MSVRRTATAPCLAKLSCNPLGGCPQPSVFCPAIAREQGKAVKAAPKAVLVLSIASTQAFVCFAPSSQPFSSSGAAPVIRRSFAEAASGVRTYFRVVRKADLIHHSAKGRPRADSICCGSKPAASKSFRHSLTVKDAKRRATTDRVRRWV